MNNTASILGVRPNVLHSRGQQLQDVYGTIMIDLMGREVKSVRNQFLLANQSYFVKKVGITRNLDLLVDLVDREGYRSAYNIPVGHLQFFVSDYNDDAVEFDEYVKIAFGEWMKD